MRLCFIRTLYVDQTGEQVNCPRAVWTLRLTAVAAENPGTFRKVLVQNELFSTFCLADRNYPVGVELLNRYLLGFSGRKGKRMKHIVFSLTAGLIVAMAPAWADPACDQVAGNLVQNCGFETGDFTGWNTSFAAVGSYLGVQDLNANSGIDSAYFGASGALSDSITSQHVYNSTNGNLVKVSFWVENLGSELPDNTAEFHAYWNGVDIWDAPTASFGYTQVSFQFTADQFDNTLSFGGRERFGQYQLDDVVVTAPESTMFPMLAVALSALLVLFRRRVIQQPRLG